MANAGHFDVEINKDDLSALAKSRKTVRKNIEEFVMEDDRKLYLLAEGRLVNLAAGDGHPTEIMDLSFAMQTLAVLHIAGKHAELDNKVYTVTAEMDQRVADLKLKAMGFSIDRLTPDQHEYLHKA
jgi:adenosylhomocysteinase